jgi:hypothetical protein
LFDWQSNANRAITARDRVSDYYGAAQARLRAIHLRREAVLVVLGHAPLR